MKRRHQLKWRVIAYAAAGYIVAITLWIPMKLNDTLPPHLTWPKMLVLPAMAMAIWPAWMFFEDWRERRSQARAARRDEP